MMLLWRNLLVLEIDCNGNSSGGGGNDYNSDRDGNWYILIMKVINVVHSSW